VATTPAKRACSVCGTLLADDSAYCPVCALRGVQETQSDSVTDPSSELRFEHYTVLRNAEGKPFELGRGAMGVTYEAFDVHLQRPAALKIINAQLFGNESARARFVREARAAASVRHQNVASVFHIGETSGNYYYAMELVEGESLAALIRRSGCLGTDLALDIVEQAAAGLAAIEKQHLIHRDIKPSNIMVSLQDGKLENVKIIDLGLAKGVAEENSLSTVGAFVGTPAYASPEQFAGIATDIRSDLYSLGVTLWEVLSGNVPFGGSAAELMYQHQHAEPPIEKLRNVPASIIALLQVLLAKDPNKRFQTPAQLLQALTKVREAIGSRSGLTAEELRSAGDRVAVNLPNGKSRQRSIRWLLGAGLCLAIILTAWFLYTRHLGSSNQGATAAAPPEKSIAVLPFDNISPNKDDAYFADGVQDEILNNLAKIAQLKVISRTSVMQYRADTKRDLRQIADALGVANVLEGTVRRDGNHVRVSTELVDARNDRTIWADSYDRDLTDIFAIQSEVAQTVAAKLSARLSPEERKGMEEKPTENLEAYDLYLQAKELIRNAEAFDGQREDYLKALTLLEEATRKDPEFALAYCSIAEAHDALYLFHLDRTAERLGLGDAAVNEALRLRPNLPEAHLAAALHMIVGDGNYERAREQIAIAEKTSPNNPSVFWFRAGIDGRQGHWQEAMRNNEKAAILEPRHPKILLDLEEDYLAIRRFRQAEQIHDRLIELRPDDPALKISKAYLFILGEKADLKNYLAVFGTVPSSLEDRVDIVSARIYSAVLARDWTKAKEILGHSRNEEFEDLYYSQGKISRGCYEIWLARLQGEISAMEPKFTVARDQLNRKVEQNPQEAGLLSALGIVDAALGRKQQAIKEASRATEMLPISKDAESGPGLITNLAIVYAWTNESELAFQELTISVKTPNSILYGELKFDPAWDPLRNDPRFDKLLAELAPKD